jgi:hypothetical protein
MKERPILFSSPMVRALLSDRKTMTRRVVSKNNSCTSGRFEKLNLESAFVTESMGGQQILKAMWDENGDKTIHRIFPKWETGDRLWVRETWLLVNGCEGLEDFTTYRADGVISYPDNEPVKWKPSIHMPRWASRITLEITNVRVERLQEISEEDCLKEGIQKSDNEGLRNWPYMGANHHIKGTPKVFSFARQAFESLWDSINGKKYPWSSNPWVWVVEFKRMK